MKKCSLSCFVGVCSFSVLSINQIPLRQQPGPSQAERPDPQAEMDAEVLREDFDDIDMANLGALLRGDTD